MIENGKENIVFKSKDWCSLGRIFKWKELNVAYLCIWYAKIYFHFHNEKSTVYGRSMLNMNYVVGS